MLKQSGMQEQDLAGFVDPLLRRIENPDQKMQAEVRRLIETVDRMSEPLTRTLREEFPLKALSRHAGPGGLVVCGPATAIALRYLQSQGFTVKPAVVVDGIGIQGMFIPGRVPDVLDESGMSREQLEILDLSNHVVAAVDVGSGWNNAVFVDFAHEQFRSEVGSFIVDTLNPENIRKTHHWIRRSPEYEEKARQELVERTDERGEYHQAYVKFRDRMRALH